MQRLPSSSVSAFALLSLAESGCDKVWGYYATGDPDNCVRTTNSCAADEFCNRQTQACEKYPADHVSARGCPDPADVAAQLPIPRGSAAGLTYPRDIAYSIGAPIESIPTASPIPTIYYTLDGTDPAPGGATTLSGPSPISLGRLAGGTTLRWFADYGSPFNAEAPHSFAVGTDTTATSNAGFIMENPSLYGGNGPVVLVPRAARVNLKIGLQSWASSPAGTCPSVRRMSSSLCPRWARSAATPISRTSASTPGRPSRCLSRSRRRPRWASSPSKPACCSSPR